jgi:hypothetical protein
MSKIKVNRIENTSTTDGGIDIDTSGHVQLDGLQLPTAGALSNRNLIINGEHKVDQRNNGSSVTLSSTTAFITDRWSSRINGGGAVARQSGTVPSGKGFKRSLKFDVTTADTSPSANDEIYVQTKPEAQDLTQLSYGSSDAKSVTISFWVQSALTGNFGFFIYQDDAVRAYQTTYNISTANTWEYKTITVPGDTAGTIDDDNGTGFEIRWYLAVGSNKGGSSNQNAWGSDFNNRHPTSTNLMASASNNWYITGIQLEVGEKATPFEHRSYGDELARSMRYFQKSYNYSDPPGSATSTGTAWMTVAQGGGRLAHTAYLKERMRATPTFKTYDWDGNIDKIRTNSGNNQGASAIYSSENAVIVDVNVSGVTENIFQYTAEAEL